MKHTTVWGFISVRTNAWGVSWGVWWALAAFAFPCFAELQRFEFDQQQMGTSFRLVFYASDASVANSSAKAAFARIADLNGVFSDYSADSESRKLADTSEVFQEDGVSVSDDLWKVLTVSDCLSRTSGGAFDVTVGPLTKLWRRARRQQRIPDATAIAKAIQSVGYDRVGLLRNSQSVSVAVSRAAPDKASIGKAPDGESPSGKPSVRFDFGGIAKGYAADEALAVLAAGGVKSVLIDAGGDLRLGAPPPGKRGWRVAVASDGTRDSLGKPGTRPLTLLLSDCGVATSGDVWQYVEADGKRYSHIIDPRSGYGLTNRTSVTIVAANATLADGLASAVSVMGAESGAKMLESFQIADTANKVIQSAGETANYRATCGRLVTFHSDGRPNVVRATHGFADLPRAE